MDDGFADRLVESWRTLLSRRMYDAAVDYRWENWRSPDLWENEVAPISVIGTAGEGVDELEVGPGVRQLGGVELG